MKPNKFLFCPDHITNELYILHTEYPACLIWVKQEMPVRFIIEELYDDDFAGEKTILNMPFVEEAKVFFKEYISKNQHKN